MTTPSKVRVQKHRESRVAGGCLRLDIWIPPKMSGYVRGLAQYLNTSPPIVVRKAVIALLQKYPWPEPFDADETFERRKVNPEQPRG